MSVDAADAHPPAPQPHLQNALALRSGALVLGRFRVGSTLGSSAHAFTYAALDEQYSERVVIKEFFPRSLVSRTADSQAVRAHSSADDQEFARGAKRFLREGELLADLAHPSLLRVRRAFEENGTAYLVADFNQVTSLRDYVRSLGGRMAPGPAVELCVRVLEALELIHAEGGLHRDISPETVGIDDQGRPVIVGFPASRHLHGHGRDLTPGFAAIELYGAKGQGPWTDVYSCAALLYFLVTGSVPPSAVDRASGESVPSPAALVPGLAPAFANALLRGLSQLPEQRTHSAAEFQKQVLTSLYLLGQPAPTLAPDLSTYPADRLPNPAPTSMMSPLTLPADPGSRALRLTTSGLVLPPEQGLGRKLMRWLSGGRRGSSEAAAEAKARLSDMEVAEIFAQLNEIGIGSPATLDTPRAQPLQSFSQLADAPPPSALSSGAAPSRMPDALLDSDLSDEDLLSDREAPLVPVREDVSIVRGLREKPFLEETADADADAFDIDLFDRYESSVAATADVASRDGSTSLFASRTLPRFHFPRAVTRRSRVALGIALLVVLGGAAVGAAYAARNQSAKNRLASKSASPSAPANRQAGNAGDATQKVAADSARGTRVETTSSGIVQQARSLPTDATRRADPQSTSTKPRAVDGSPSNVPTLSGLQSVNVPISTQTGAPQLLPPETLIDLRDRLAAGRQFSEGGDYASAGRVLRSALTQIDSLSTRFAESEALRSLRKDVEQEAQRALGACVAENEIHRKRGGKILVCQ